MHRKSADLLKVTWYIVMLKQIWSTKIPKGGGRVSTFSPLSIRNIREVRQFSHDRGNHSPRLCSGVLANRLRVQNSASRLVTKCPRSDHITPILRELHWLPVKPRVQYKLLVTTYKALHGNAPFYLSEMLQPYRSTRS